MLKTRAAMDIDEDMLGGYDSGGENEEDEELIDDGLVNDHNEPAPESAAPRKRKEISRRRCLW